MLKDILIGAAVIIVGAFLAWIAFIYLSTMMNMIRKSLVEYCMRHRLSASPWALLVWEGIWAVEWTTGMYSTWLMDRKLFVPLLSHACFPLAVMGMAVFPLLVLLVKARLRLVPLLLTKVLCIPLDVMYVISRGYQDEDFIPDISSRPSGSGVNNTPAHSQSTVRSASGQHPVAGRPRAVPIHHSRSDTSPADSRSRQDRNQSPLYAADPSHEHRLPEYLEKYTDQHRTRQEADHYATIKVGGETINFSDEYVPFTGTNDPVEVRQYDADYAPFE